MTKQELKDIFDAMFIVKDKKLYNIGFVELNEDTGRIQKRYAFSRPVHIDENTRLFVKKHHPKYQLRYDFHNERGDSKGVDSIEFDNKKDAEQFIKYINIKRVEMIF